MEEKKRQMHNSWIDGFKVLACFAVVCLHCNYTSEEITDIVYALARFAIPYFFMVSGYYLYQNHRTSPEILLKRAKRVNTIGLVSVLFYLGVKIGICIFGDAGNSISNTLRETFSLSSITKWVLFNLDPVINILWFLFAMAYSYVILYLVEKKNKIYLAYNLIIPLFLVHFICGAGLGVIGYSIPTYFYRNYFLFALPCMLFGSWLHQNQNNLLSRINRYILIISMLIGQILCIVETKIVGRQELYLGALIVSCSMILFAVSEKTNEPPSFLVKIGRNYSLYVYLFQIFVGIVFNKLIGSRKEALTRWNIVNPICIFFLCIVLAKIWIRFKVLVKMLITKYQKKRGVNMI